MLTEDQIARIKQLRRRRGCSWHEIAEITGIPHHACYYAARRKKSKLRLKRLAAARKRAEKVKAMRRHIQHLERKLREVGVQI